jgi:translation initiation factor 2B subunit (eIF-2B alpha/beta/delta family)
METIIESPVATTQFQQTSQKIQIVMSDEISSNQLLSNFNELYTYVKSIHQNKITPTNIVMIVSELIQVVEKYNYLTGPQKKMLVINVIKKVVNEESSSDEEKVALNIIIDNTLPHMIDGFVGAINGMMKFVKDSNKSWLKKLFCCF